MEAKFKIKVYTGWAKPKIRIERKFGPGWREWRTLLGSLLYRSQRVALRRERQMLAVYLWRRPYYTALWRAFAFFFLCTHNTTELSCCCCFSRLATSRPLGERSEPCLGRPRATKSREVRRRSERSDGGLFCKSFVFNGGGKGGCYSRGALVWWILVKGGRQLLVISVSIVQGEHLVPVSILWPDKISSRNRA